MSGFDQFFKEPMFSDSYLSIYGSNKPIKQWMKRPFKLSILSMHFFAAFSLAMLMGFEWSHAETATPKENSVSRSTTLEKIPSKGQCPQPLLDWAKDDKANKKFFLLWPMDSMQGTICRHALETNKTRDVSDLKKTYQDVFADRLKDVSFTPIQNCPLPNNEDGVLTTSKYFMALRKIDEGLSRVIDESAAINATLPKTAFDPTFCDNSFKTHGPKCDNYKKSCQQSSEASYDALSKDATAAANKIFCINLIDQTCKSNGGAAGIVSKLGYNSAPQLRQCLGLLSKQDVQQFANRADVIGQNFCNEKKNTEIINQTLMTYPYLIGEEFRKTIDPNVTATPIFGRNDQMRGYDVTGPAKGKFPFDPAQVKKAMTNQLEANREGLREKKKNLESAYYCLTGQQISHSASRADCSPAFLNKATNGVYLSESERSKGSAERLSAIQLYQCQQTVTDIHSDRDQLSSMTTEGTKAVAFAGLSALSGLLTAPAAVERLAVLSNIVRLGAGAAVIGAETTLATSGAKQAYESCVGENPTAALSLAQNKALDGKTCPSSSDVASQAIRVANSCFIDSMFSLADGLSLGLAGRTANNIRKGVQEAVHAAPSSSAASTEHAVVASTPASAGGSAVGADAQEAAGSSGVSGKTDKGDRRHPEVEHSPIETSKNHRSQSREKVVADNVNRTVSADKNEAWTLFGSKVKSDGKTKFLDIQNLWTKWLNDTTLDKDLITSLNNKHADLSEAKVKELLKKHPEVRVAAVKPKDSLPESELEAFAQSHPDIKTELKNSLSDSGFQKMMKDHPEMQKDLEALYEDFKSQRWAFEPVPPLQKIPGSWEKDLDQGLKEVNEEFAKYVQENKLLRESGDAGTWFRAGYGDTGDQANLATRYSKKQEENRLYSFNEKPVQKALKKTMTDAENTRRTLSKELGQSGLWDTEAGRMSFKTEVFELTRKSKSPSELREKISKTMNVDISEDQARRIMDYAKAIDEFSPGINIIQREVATLTGAVHGGVSIDFKGMGGQNLKETAEALAGNKRDITSAIEDARLGEGAVTVLFKAKMEKIRNAVEQIAKENGIQVEIKASGDDMVIVPKNKEMSKKVLDQITDALAKEVSPASIRMSAIPSGVAADARGTLGTIGESIEKEVRANLLGKIPTDRLNQLLFRIDMQVPSGSGATATLSTSTSGLKPTVEENRLIEQALKDSIKAVEKQNAPTVVPAKPAKPSKPRAFNFKFELDMTA